MTKFVHSGDEKRKFVRQMFGQIAGRYDFLNTVLTLGMDASWRRSLIAEIEVRPDHRVLDLACGTGAVAREMLKRHPDITIVGADPVPEMLIKAGNRVPEMVTVCCESEALPFADDSFDIVTVSFGVRNFSYLDRGLSEIQRVLRSSGRVGILEFARPERSMFRWFYDGYMRWVLPKIGALLSKGYAYQYLPESIGHFPAPGDFNLLLEAVGFSRVVTRKRFGGAVRVYSGQKD